MFAQKFYRDDTVVHFNNFHDPIRIASRVLDLLCPKSTGGSYLSRQVVLPTAPRAALGTDLDDSRIPWSPPFTAYLANLPYDVDEDQVKDVFVKCKLKVSYQLAGRLILGAVLRILFDPWIREPGWVKIRIRDPG
jgi:hypothetical protein